MLKKIISVLAALSLALVPCLSLAEAADTATTTEMDTESLKTIDITMDKVPEGYTYTTENADGALYATFTCEGKPTYIVSVAYIDFFADYTLDVSELADEELDEMIDLLGEGYDMPTISFHQTEHGTDLIVIDETDAENDYGEILTIYQGFFISCEMLSDVELTEDDYQVAYQILSDLWPIWK